MTKTELYMVGAYLAYDLVAVGDYAEALQVLDALNRLSGGQRHPMYCKLASQGILAAVQPFLDAVKGEIDD